MCYINPEWAPPGSKPNAADREDHETEQLKQAKAELQAIQDLLKDTHGIEANSALDAVKGCEVEWMEHCKDLESSERCVPCHFVGQPPRCVRCGEDKQQWNGMDFDALIRKCQEEAKQIVDLLSEVSSLKVDQRQAAAHLRGTCGIEDGPDARLEPIAREVARMYHTINARLSSVQSAYRASEEEVERLRGLLTDREGYIQALEEEADLLHTAGSTATVDAFRTRLSRLAKLAGELNDLANVPIADDSQSRPTRSETDAIVTEPKPPIGSGNPQ